MTKTLALDFDPDRTPTEVQQLVSVLATSLMFERDTGLQAALRLAAGTPSDQPLVLRVPRWRGLVEIAPDGAVRLQRSNGDPGAPSLESLASADDAVRQRIAAASSRALDDARKVLIPIFAPGRLPSRAEFERLQAQAPLIERTAYRFCARGAAELDSWRGTALREAVTGARGDTVIERYYALAHTVAHLSLVSSSPEARPWLADMAQSFQWVNWTPTLPLVRERTLWLTAAAARSAAAFGPGVAGHYLKALGEAGHVLKLFDALYGLVAIALAESGELQSIESEISAAARAPLDRIIVGREYADTAFRSALNAIQTWRGGSSVDGSILDRLQWSPGSLQGLATPEAFRLDPTEIGPTGDMLGFAVLPFVMRTPASFHYPVRSRTPSPLLPKLKEMPSLMRNAWGAETREVASLH